jgi:hypothetical protein
MYRDKALLIQVTIQERELFKKIAKDLHYESLSELIRQLLYQKIEEVKNKN